MSKRLELFDRLIAEGSSDPFHHYARALELRSLGRIADALTALTGVVERFPTYVPSYLIAAQLAHELGDHANARALGRAGIEAARSSGNEHALGELTSFVDSLPG